MGDGVDPLRVVMINLDHDVILAKDRDSEALLRLGINIRDRSTRELRLVTVEPPLWSEEDEFRKAVLEWFGTMAGVAPTAIMPEDLQEWSTVDGAYKAWVKITAKLFHYAPIRRAGVEIFLAYCSPWVRGCEEFPATKKAKTPLQKSEAWIRRNINITDGPKILAMLLCINDTVKKNAFSLLEKISLRATKSPLLPTSPKPQGSVPLQSVASHPSKSGFGFSA